MNGNIADVLAKNNAQHTLVSLLGLAISVHFAKFANSSTQTMWAIYAILTAIHMYSNYKAMRVLALRSLNLSRFGILAKRFIAMIPTEEVNSTLNSATSSTTELLSTMFDNALHSPVFSKENIALSEPILSLLFAGDSSVVDVKDNSKVIHSRHILHFWHSPKSLLSKFTYTQLMQSLQTFKDEKYIILTENNHNNSSIIHIYISFMKHCTAEEQAKGIFEAYLNGFVGTDSATNSSMLSVRRITREVFPIFWSILKANRWNLDLVQLRPTGALVFEMS